MKNIKWGIQALTYFFTKKFCFFLTISFRTGSACLTSASLWDCSCPLWTYSTTGSVLLKKTTALDWSNLCQWKVEGWSQMSNWRHMLWGSRREKLSLNIKVVPSKTEGHLVCAKTQDGWGQHASWEWKVCVCVSTYCAEIMMGSKAFSRDTGGGMCRLLWVSKYSYIRHENVTLSSPQIFNIL